jgi:hypothetical protein
MPDVVDINLAIISSLVGMVVRENARLEPLHLS